MTDPLQPDDAKRSESAPETPAWTPGSSAWTPDPAASERAKPEPMAAPPDSPAWNAPATPAAPVPETPAWTPAPVVTPVVTPAAPAWTAPAPTMPTADPNSDTTTQPTAVVPTPAYTAPAQPTYQQPQFQQPQFQQPYQQPGGYPQQGYVQPGAYPQQPGYPPGYQAPVHQQPQPGYAPYAAPVPTGYGSSALASIGGLLLLLIGIAMMGIGGAIIAVGSTLGPIKELGMSGSIQTGVGAGMIVFGFLAFIAGLGSMAHKSWARALGLLLALVGIVVGGLLAFLATQKGPSGKVGEVVADLGSGQRSYVLSIVNGVVPLVVFGVILLALLVGGRHFRKQ